MVICITSSSGGILLGSWKMRLIRARTVIWAAGVRASPLGAALARTAGATLDRAGRVVVEPDLSLARHPEIFVIGDTASAKRPDGSPVPGIAPAAKQAGWHVASVIKRRLAGDTAARPFVYKHDGDLATIGKRAAVFDNGRFTFTGWPAWWLWGVAHIFFLIGLRYRLAVALSWLWIYFTGQRSARLITQGADDEAMVAALQDRSDQRAA